jgi:hypothetical protein
MTRCAAAWEFHKEGSSARALSSASRFSAISQSKMPPQQGQRSSDLRHHRFGFATHDMIPSFGFERAL